MKPLLAAVFLGAAALVHGAEPVRPPAAASATNTLVIISEDGARFTRTNAVWRRGVRAADADMYIECELLTAAFNTNATRTNVTRVIRDEAPRLDEAGSDSRLDFIIAETNVMIITAEAQIIGDRAVYNATNDVLIVTGELVVAVNKQGSFVTTRVIFDRRANTFEVGGTNMFISAPGAFSGTNTPSSLRGPAKPPRASPSPPQK